MRKLIYLTVVTSFVAWAGAAFAFPFIESWHMPASGRAGTNRAGGEGIYGTGGAQDYGLRCSNCHTKGAGMIDLSVSPTPAWQNVGGEDAYRPNQRYTITVSLVGEHLMPGTLNNLNGMGLTIEDASGHRAGRFISDAGQDSNSCPSAPPTKNVTKTTVVYGDCHGVLFQPNQGLTSWTFDWVAPAAGAGNLTIYVGVVDGSSAGESSLDDDTVERSIPLSEGS